MVMIYQIFILSTPFRQKIVEAIINKQWAHGVDWASTLLTRRYRTHVDATRDATFMKCDSTDDAHIVAEPLNIQTT